MGLQFSHLIFHKLRDIACWLEKMSDLKKHTGAQWIASGMWPWWFLTSPETGSGCGKHVLSYNASTWCVYPSSGPPNRGEGWCRDGSDLVQQKFIPGLHMLEYFVWMCDLAVLYVSICFFSLCYMLSIDSFYGTPTFWAWSSLTSFHGVIFLTQPLIKEAYAYLAAKCFHAVPKMKLFRLRPKIHFQDHLTLNMEAGNQGFSVLSCLKALPNFVFWC